MTKFNSKYKVNFFVFSSCLIFLLGTACVKKGAAPPPVMEEADFMRGFTANNTNDSVSFNWDVDGTSEYVLIQTDGDKAKVPANMDLARFQLGQVFGNNKVVFVGPQYSFEINGLQIGATYLFTLYQKISTGKYTTLSTLKMVVGSGMMVKGENIPAGSSGPITKGTSSRSTVSRPSSLMVNVADSALLLSWVSGGKQSGFLLLRSTTGPITVLPKRGQEYSVGDSLDGDVTVAYVGGGLSTIDGGLENNVRYYYSIHAYDNKFYYSSGFKGYRTPIKNAALAPKITISPQSGNFTLSWNKGTSGATGFILLKRKDTTASGTVASLTNGRIYKVGDVSDDGGYTVIYVGNETTFADTQIENKKTYYYTLILSNSDKSYSKYTAGAGGVYNPPAQTAGGTSLTTKCKLHAGRPFAWEGSGICTGNLMSVLPLLGTSLRLIHNSNDASSNYGFAHGFRLSVDRRIKLLNSSQLVVEEGDGSPMAFTSNAGQWVSDNLSVSRNKLVLNDQAGTATETHKSGLTYSYQILKNAEGSNAQYGLIKITYPTGRYLSIAREEHGFIQSVKDDLGNEIAFVISGGKTTRIVNSGGYGYSLSYSPNLSEITYDAKSETKTWLVQYTGDLVYSIRDTIGGEIFAEYNYTGSASSPAALASITNPLGYKTSFTYGDMMVTSEGFTGTLIESFNTSGELISLENIKIKDTFQRNNLGQVTSHTDHFGIKVDYTYDSEAFLKSVISSTGLRINYDRTADSIKETVTGPTGQLVTQYLFSNDRLASISGPGNYKANFNYDASGRLTDTIENGRNIQSAQYYDSGLIKSLSFEAGSRTYSFGYTNSGQLNQVTTPAGKYALSYATNQQFGLPTKIQGPGVDLNSEYDGMGRETLISVGGGNKAPYSVTTTYAGTDTTTADSYQTIRETNSHELQEVEVKSFKREWLQDATVIFHKIFARGN